MITGVGRGNGVMASSKKCSVALINSESENCLVVTKEQVSGVRTDSNASGINQVSSHNVIRTSTFDQSKAGIWKTPQISELSGMVSSSSSCR